MKSRFFSGRLIASAVAMVAVAVIPQALDAGNTGTTLLLRPQGQTAARNQGDYVSTNGGFGSYYRFFIEVPPGTPNLRVDIFDRDVTGTHDRTFNSFDTSTVFTLLTPTGGTQATYTAPNNSSSGNNSWNQLGSTVNNPTAGHWELRVNMGNGDDWNSFGIRAYDSSNTANSNANGVELNIYADPFMNVGVNEGGEALYSFYPYFTSHCDARVHEFDWDESGTNPDGIAGSGDDNGFIRVTSRDGLYTNTYIPLSDNDVWVGHNITGSPSWPGRYATTNGFPAGQSSRGYGIFTALVQIDDDIGNTAGQGNYGQFFFTRGTATPATPPGGWPGTAPTGYFRTYFPRDGANGDTPGGAPVKPYVEQFYEHVSGPNPPVAGQTTRVAVHVTVTNPTPHNITFSSTGSRYVTANVPGNQGGGVGTAYYRGVLSNTHGSIVSQPAVFGNSSGTVTWNPGVVAGGATAMLRYAVDVTPANASSTPNVTGTPASNGTQAVFYDETGNTTQARATFTFGPLCQLSFPSPNSNTPLFVDLESFEAVRNDDNTVTVRWSTAAEYATTGFNVYRELDGGIGKKVNDFIIPAQGSETAGADYVLLDSALLRDGEVRGFFLEDVDASGAVTRHGPVFVASRPVNDGGPRPIEAIEELSDLHWSPWLLEDFSPADLSIREGSMMLSMPPRHEREGKNVYGAFETREPLEALPAGKHVLRAHIEWTPGLRAIPPTARVRVFHDEFSTVWSTEVVSSEWRKKELPKFIDTVWESDGVTPWFVSLELLSQLEGQDGGFRITKLESFPAP